MDEQQKVRTITALALAALAEAATPYGIESFDSVLKPLWKGIRQHRGKVRKNFFGGNIDLNIWKDFPKGRSMLYGFRFSRFDQNVAISSYT